MNLSNGKSIFYWKIVSSLLFCLLCFDLALATDVPNTPFDVESMKSVSINEQPMGEIFYQNAPVDVPHDDNRYYDRKRNKSFIDGQILSDYSGIDGPFIKYYNENISICGSLNNYHEENFLYSNGQHGISYYDGILTKVIKDFDNDNVPEMAIFKMNTSDVDEFSNKYITLDMYEMINDTVYLSDTMVISSEQYLGEEIECDISLKFVDDVLRIYLNYFDRKVREEEYESKFIALEYHDNLNIVSEVNMSATEDDYYEGSFEFQDLIIDAGINLQDDIDIYKKAFLNNDLQVIPIFTIKRYNEKIKDGFVEDYFLQHFDEMNEEGYIKLRYGYTQFIDRTVRY